MKHYAGLDVSFGSVRSGAVVAMAVQRIGRGGLARNLNRDPTCHGVSQGSGGQGRPQRCARALAADYSGLPTASCLFLQKLQLFATQIGNPIRGLIHRA